MPGLCENDSDHALSIESSLNMSLGFLMGLLRAKRELTVKRGDALDMSCALSELSKSLTFF